MSEGKKCHICLYRKRSVVACAYCGHNTCHSVQCMVIAARGKMCWKCQVDLSHRTPKEVPVA